jgi:hypothetical protein
MLAAVEEVLSLRFPCVKLVGIEAVATPLPICIAEPLPFSLTPNEFVKMSAKVIELLLKAVVFAFAMLFPVTPKAFELARKPDSAVENEKGI